MKLVEMQPAMSLTSKGLEEALIRLSALESVASVVLLICGPADQFAALRLLKVQEVTASVRTSESPAWINLVVHHTLPRFTWMLVGQEVILHSRGA